MSYLDLFNGGVRSEFDAESLATEARVEKTAAGHGTHYKITQPMGLRVGGGGPEFHFESINGDVHIRRQ